MTDYDFVPGHPAIGQDVGGTPFNPGGSTFGAWLNDILRRGAASHWVELTENATATVDDHGTAYRLAGHDLALDPAADLHAGWFVRVEGPGTLTPDEETARSFAQGEWAVVGSDGTSIFVQRSNAGNFDIAMSLERPKAGLEFPIYVIGVAGVVPEDLVGSHAVAAVAPTDEAVFSLRKNGVEFGTVTFAAEETVGVLAAEADTEFAAGDRFSVLSPAVRDPTLAGVSITIQGAKL